MRALAQILASYVTRHVEQALERAPDTPVRPILVGPPDEALRELFAILTDGGNRDWQLPVGSTMHEIVVLLVGDNLPPLGRGLSQACHWDYAVTIRNSCRLVAILSTRSSWDTRPESLANTTEGLGDLSAVSRGSEDALQAYLVTALTSHLGLAEKQTRELLRVLRRDSNKLELARRDAVSWEVLDRLFVTSPGQSAVDAACCAVGLPVIGGNGKSFSESYDTLRSLAGYIGSDGIADAIEHMKNTDAAQRHAVVPSLDSLQQHLQAVLVSPADFERSPSYYFYVPPPAAPWYDSLTVDVLSDILTELNQKQPQDRLVLTCTNTLPTASPVRGLFVVADGVGLRASSARGTQAAGVSFTRKVDRQAPSPVAPSQGNPLECVDSHPPLHRKAIKYKCEAPGFRAGTVDIISLDSFDCGGIVVVRDAERNSVPTYTTRAATWNQELTLLRGGATEFLVFHGSNASSISFGRTGGTASIKQVQPGAHYVSFNEDVDDSDSFEVAIFDAAGTAIGSWPLQVIIKDTADVSNSRVESLIYEHQTGRKSVPQAADSPLQRLELGSYLPCADSWQPVLGCWAERSSPHLSIDWNSDRMVGDVRPVIDPRPTINPPAPVLAAREEVRSLLQSQQRCIAEIELDNAALLSRIEAYLDSYFCWLQQEPDAACWLDTFVIHTAALNAQAGRHVASDEPAMLLLSPLHPLRLAWAAVAQKELAESLQVRCPAAGLLTPSHCPDAGILYLAGDSSPKPRAFFSLPCEHPHWAALLNTTFIDKADERALGIQRLAELGLKVQSITGGFTSSQTQDSLREVVRLLPARSILRVGIVGDSKGSSECGDGVFSWSEREFSQERVSPTGCIRAEIFDTRGATDPSPEQLADLSDTTSERVRWFKKTSSDLPRLDLVIVDQLGARSAGVAPGTTRSALTCGGAIRVRIREDFQNARTIMESRVSGTRLSGPQLPQLVTRAIVAYEALSAKDGDHTHFRFAPNQDAVGSRLQDAIFLSVTSSQIDPACIARGTVAQGGYLWDYELPGVLTGGESGLGYYLIAQPTTAMTESIERAAALVLNPPPSVHGLLEEISRHGIPVLKRLASGGSQSRGELGLLLATRLVQDCFRSGAPDPRLPVWRGNCIHLVLPVDPYQDLFDRFRRALNIAGSAQRPDLIVVAVQLHDERPVSIKLTPLEVKYRANGMAATEMREALTQAESLGKLLEHMCITPPLTDLWRTCTAAVLAQFLDFGFRIYAGQWLHQHQPGEWALAHQRVMQDLLEGVASLTVNTAGRLIVFDGSPSSQVADLDGDSRQDTVVISLGDASALLSSSQPVSEVADAAVQQLDFSFPGCFNVVAADLGVSAPPPDVPEVAEFSATGSPPASALSQHEPTAIAPSEDEAQPRVDQGAGEVGRPQGTRGSRVPPELRLRVREGFEGFVGNEPAVTRLSNDLLRALIEEPPHLAKNYLFTGLPSTGKTELARRMAGVLQLPFVKLDGRTVASRDKLFELINGELRAHNMGASQIGQQVGLPVLEYPPVIIFIDEVHLVPRSLQEALLTMLEAADRTVVLSDHVAKMNHATFLFATTRASDVDAAFVSRCDEIQLREYTEVEVARILAFKIRDEAWSDDVYRTLARLGRCVPRVAIQLAEALETAVMVSEEDKPVLEHLDDVRRAREIDERGLTRMDFQYLAILEQAQGPVGEQNILNLIRTVDKERILNEVEPFLVRLGFVRHGPRGRELTREGREYFLAHRLGR